MSAYPTILIAFFAGILPAIFWLSFWIKEDKHPEPKWLIILTFILGMMAVPAVIPLEKFVLKFAGQGLLLITLWAFIEEIFKYAAAAFALRRREDDEPVDPLIYLITSALGFAALENAFFLFNPLLNEGFVGAFITGNMRFIGATLLHTVSSGIIGIFIGLSFYRNSKSRRSYAYTGIGLSVLLHALFNFLIIQGKGETLIAVFAGVWILVIILLLMFEVLKKLEKPLKK